MGNPLSYYNGYSYTFTWTQGRRLASAVKGSDTLSFTYNDEGIRTSKTVNGITHYYQLAGSQILSENWIDESGIYHVVIFIYDENGAPIGMSYSNSTYAEDVADNYLFIKNMQGDIVHICDEEGNKIVSYQYDAWGTVTSYSGSNTNAYKINPFRYRGYVYDAETRLYYLNSRYYDPEMGRFISADGVMSGADGSLQGANLFAYCFNNPVNLDDSDGNWPKWLEKATKAVAVVAVVVAAVAVVAATAGTGSVLVASIALGATSGGLVGGIANEAKGESFINGYIGGAVSGATQAAATCSVGYAGTILGGGFGSGIGTAITEGLNNIGKSPNQKKSSKDIAASATKSASLGMVMGTVTAGIGAGVNFAQQNPLGYNAWANSLSPDAAVGQMTPGFGEMVNAFFGGIDDSVVYIFAE